jgi:ribosomal protein L40E
MTDSELKYLGGWNDEARRMVSLYAHMDADRVNGKLLNLAGLVPEEEQRQSELSVSPCPRCNALNPEGQEFCGTCGLPLTSEGLEQFKHKTSEIEELRVKIESIENSRESLTLLLKKVLELEKKLNEQKTA